MNSKTNIINVIFRIGLIFLVSGIMVGLFFGEWTEKLIVGIIFTISPGIGKGIHLLKENMTRDEAISQAEYIEFVSRQELPRQFTT